MWRYAILIPLAVTVMSQADDHPRGLWLTPRKDPRNQARADVAGRMTVPPREVWRISTGGLVYAAHTVQVGGEDCVLAHVGTNLVLKRADGETVWQQTRLGIGAVMRLDDFDGDGRPEVMAHTGARGVVLLEVATGAVLWQWQTAPSTQVSGVAFLPTGNGVRFYCLPAYGDDGWCFDFSGSRVELPSRSSGAPVRPTLLSGDVPDRPTGVSGVPQPKGRRGRSRCEPKLVWHQSYAGKYGVGYGPSIVLADMDGDGKQDLVLSGKMPGVYQAVVDADTGAIKHDVNYMVEGLDWGRPYGLCQVTDLDGDGYPDLVMVSCQVEEYVAVARNVGGKRLEPVWQKFIEKDWPTDTQELRPQVTSVCDVNGDGRPELVLGLWDGTAWRTAVMDPLAGFEARRETEPGWYFWGCHDLNGDGRAEIIVSRESRRRTARVTTLAALDGQTLQPVAELPEAAVFASGDTALHPDRYFMAIRANPVFLKTADGWGGILVRRYAGGKEASLSLWGARRGEGIGPRRVAEAGWVRAHVTGGELILGDAQGGLQRHDGNLRPTGPRIAISGRGCQPLVWERNGRRELVFGRADAVIVGGEPDLKRNGELRGRWEAAGVAPCLHLDANGKPRLVAADVSDPDNYAALIHDQPWRPGAKPVRIPLDFPPYGHGVMPFGPDCRVLVDLQTGVHTFALACYDAEGKLLWRDTASGAYPRDASADDLDGDGRWEVIADDHGSLKVYDAEGKVIGSDPGWPPAYSVQIIGPFAPGGEKHFLRASGIDGNSLNDQTGRALWETTCSRWRHYGALAAVGDVAGDGHLHQGTLAEDGTFECLDSLSGRLRWSLPLRTTVAGNPIVAGDVDGDGRDEFLVGTLEGALLCIGEREGRGVKLWRKRFPAGVVSAIIADVDGDGVAEVVVATSDGYLRVLKERMP